MRIIGQVPLQFLGPTPHHPLIPQPPFRAGGGRSSLTPGPGPGAQGLKPSTWGLNAPYIPLHSVCQGLEKPGHLGCLHSGWWVCHPACQCPGCGVHHSCPWWRGLSLGGVLILRDTWQVKQKGGSRQVLALSRSWGPSSQGSLLVPLGDDGTTLSSSILRG